MEDNRRIVDRQTSIILAVVLIVGASFYMHHMAQSDIALNAPGSTNPAVISASAEIHRLADVMQQLVEDGTLQRKQQSQEKDLSPGEGVATVAASDVTTAATAITVSPSMVLDDHWSIAQPILAVDKRGFVEIPDKYTILRIDIGLSWNAPHSALWLDKERLPGRYVFAFEPNAQSLGRVINGKFNPQSDDCCGQLDRSHVNRDWIGVRAALDEGPPHFTTFHYMESPGEDPGTSSLLPEKNKEREAKTIAVTVPVIPLSELLSRIDFERFTVIEHLKVDAQGVDGRVLRSAGNYLAERVVYVTVELQTHQYEGENLVDPKKYLESQGFRHLGGENFVNTRFEKYAEKMKLHLSTKAD